MMIDDDETEAAAADTDNINSGLNQQWSDQHT